MHPYLHHLLQDIAAAHRTEAPPYQPPHSFEEEMEDIERWCAGQDASYTFGEHCGLKAEDFPPPSQLTPNEMQLVCKAFRKMMFTYNLDDSFPPTLPPAFDYELLVDTLNEKTFIPLSGFASFNYCSGYAPDCKFKEYCPCWDVWMEQQDKGNRMEMPPRNDDEELPF